MPNLTINQFIDRFTVCAGEHKWEVTSTGAIRCRMKGEYRCPLTVLLYAERDELVAMYRLTYAGLRLGLTSKDTWRIANAADDIPNHDPAIRKRLSEAVNLSLLERN